MSPCAECNMHWLLELASASGTAGPALASAEAGKKPHIAGATTSAANSPVATALRTAGTIPRDFLRANLRILKSRRFIDPPSSEQPGLGCLLFPRSVIHVTVRRNFPKQFVTQLQTASSQPQ